jgi:hypothetical protein
MIISTDTEEMYNLKAFYSEIQSTFRPDSLQNSLCDAWRCYNCCSKLFYLSGIRRLLVLY